MIKIETDDFKKSKKSLLTLSFGTLAIWLLDVKIHELSIWGVNVEKHGEGYLYVLVLILLLYLYASYLLHKKSAFHKWRLDAHELEGIAHSYNMAMASLNSATQNLGKYNYTQLIFEKTRILEALINQIYETKDTKINLEEFSNILTRSGTIDLVSNFSEDAVVKIYKHMDNVAKEIETTRKALSKKSEEISGLGYWNNTAYKLYDSFFPKLFFVLAVIAVIQKIVVLSGMWSFLSGLF